MIWAILIIIFAIVIGELISLILRGRIFGTRKGEKIEIIEKKNYAKTIPFDGTKKSLDELPPELRAQVEKMLAAGVKKSEKIVIERDGRRYEYSSLEEVPPEMRSALESMREEGAEGEAPAHKIIIKKDGQTYEYNSIDEVPPELRIFLKRK